MSIYTFISIFMYNCIFSHIYLFISTFIHFHFYLFPHSFMYLCFYVYIYLLSRLFISTNLFISTFIYSNISFSVCKLGGHVLSQISAIELRVAVLKLWGHSDTLWCVTKWNARAEALCCGSCGNWLNAQLHYTSWT